MPDPLRTSLQAALMAMSAWFLGALLLGAPYSLVGVGGIVVLLGTLVGVRLALRALFPPEDDLDEDDRDEDDRGDLGHESGRSEQGWLPRLKRLLG